MKPSHLNEDQLLECLIEDSAAGAVEMHLRECAACREELGHFRAGIESFNRETLAWSQTRPVQTPRIANRGKTTFWKVNCAAALALIMLMALLVPVQLHRNKFADSSPIQSQGTDEADAAAEIQQDNDLMAAVSQEINRNESSALVEDIVHGGHTAKHHTEVRAE